MFQLMPSASCSIIVPHWESSCTFPMSSDQVTVDRNKAFPRAFSSWDGTIPDLSISLCLSYWSAPDKLDGRNSEYLNLSPVTSSSALLISRPTFSQIFLLIPVFLVYIFVMLCLLNSLNPIEALAFLTHFYAHRKCLFIPPRYNISTSTFFLHPFLYLSSVRNSVSTYTGLWPACLMFYTLMWIMCSEEALLEDQPALTGFFLPGQFPTRSYKKILNKQMPALLQSRVLYSPQDTNLHESHCHCSKAAHPPSPAVHCIISHLQQGTVFNIKIKKLKSQNLKKLKH